MLQSRIRLCRVGFLLLKFRDVKEETLKLLKL